MRILQIFIHLEKEASAFLGSIESRILYIIITFAFTTEVMSPVPILASAQPQLSLRDLEFAHSTNRHRSILSVDNAVADIQQLARLPLQQ